METPRINEILSRFDTSNWLKEALSKALQRDAVDVANDAELLYDLLDERCKLILKSNLA